MINKSISYRLSIFVSFAVIIVFIAFIAVSYVFDKQLLKENIESQAIVESSKIIMQVQKQVVSTREIAGNISEQILYYGLHNDVDLFINSIIAKYPFINAIHINIDSTVPNQNYHNFVSAREKDSITFRKGNKPFYHCAFEKESIHQVIMQEKPGWTKPFRCPETDVVIVSYVSPIEINDESNVLKRRGEVICELSLLELNKLINATEIGDVKDSYAFLASEQGDYITHPNKEWILNRNLYTLSDRVYDKEKVDVKEILSNQLTGITTAFSDLLDYQKTWVYYTTVKETGWLLVFVLPYSELFQPLYVMLLQLLFFSVIGILVIYFIITYITGKLVEPLSTVTTQLKRFSNLSGQTTINTLNEVKLISESLDYLKNWYDSYRISQSQEKKRSARQIQDLEQASEIQQSLIKTDYSSFSEKHNVDLFALYKPARIVSGDLFDYFFIDDENMIFTIGDVSGKGVPAAIFMSIAQTIIKSSTTVKRARNIVKKASGEIYTNNQHQFFLTLFVGVLNVKTGLLNYSNAAHTATLIVKQDGQITELNHSHGLPLGLYPDKEYTDRKIQISKGDKIILYSDGITEQLNEKNAQLGLDGLKKIIWEATSTTPNELVKEIEQKLEDYKGEQKQNDDITLFIIQY
ncbi:SpoIIE family protein phosphatase [Maribellus comscasis]|uniref:SpoIIE family protein phosphatase n=1 Tax=Maribellus comscasis TaxID=2681766 RepID=A0A6I6JXH9_9BACT|nr:SpoIIE family protein phosphatase [Maribellus comscasis]QGY47261.1 SpoIIE family protein phosphatase [Maribellus comscasis]